MTSRQRTKIQVGRVLEAAIAEETAAVQAELGVARSRILHLEAVIRGVMTTLGRELGGAPLAAPVQQLPEAAAAVLSMLPEPEPEMAGGNLSGEDDMGAGRWV